MKKIQIALFDTDGFMINLADYLCKKNYNTIETRLYTDYQILKNEVKNGKVDVLLAEENDFSKIELLKKSVVQIILLVEGNQVAEGYTTDYIPVFKFQSAKAIVREILFQVSENDKIECSDIANSSDKIDFISVFTPVGGTKTGEMARDLVKEISREYKTLYIDLELFAEELFAENSKKEILLNRGMSEIIYYLKQKKDKLLLKLESIIIQKETYDLILPVGDYRDLYHMDLEDMQSFLELLSKSQKYQKVVFSIGYISDATLWLMEQSTDIYMPKCETEAEKKRVDAFYRFLQRDERRELEKKFIHNK